jgi:hypothetical protein
MTGSVAQAMRLTSALSRGTTETVWYDRTYYWREDASPPPAQTVLSLAPLSTPRHQLKGAPLSCSSRPGLQAK